MQFGSADIRSEDRSLLAVLIVYRVRNGPWKAIASGVDQIHAKAAAFNRICWPHGLNEGDPIAGPNLKIIPFGFDSF